MKIEKIRNSQQALSGRFSATSTRHPALRVIGDKLRSARLAMHAGEWCWLQRVAVPNAMSETVAGHWEKFIPLLPSNFFSILFDNIKSGKRCCVIIDDSGRGGFRTSVEEDKRVVMEAHRNWSLSEKWVQHAVIRSRKQRQDQLLPARFLRNSFELYLPLGVEAVTLNANYEDGGYVWAKFGFQPTSIEEWHRLARQVEAKATDYRSHLDRHAYSHLKSLTASDNPTAVWTISDLNKRINGRKLGALLLRGTTWAGTISLKDKPAIARFNTYLKEKLLPPLSRSP